MFCKLNQQDVLFQNKWTFVFTQIYVSFSVSLDSGKCVYVIVYWRERGRQRETEGDDGRFWQVGLR